ncbi:MAG: DoxX family membrane protein [Bacteroidetes bacterium]|nr:MAG: DoxX family membrane protein [Bacteroidota bacterium]TAG86054.1 MAG: DoxX family membrane protein [Bacteroidota bacterium]
MAIVLGIPRYLLGLAYIVFGLNFFFKFIPLPDMSGDGKAFMDILINNNFMLVVKIIEIVGGVMLLLGIFSKLALFLLMPISVNILLFHTMISQDSPVMGIILVSLNFISFFAYREDLQGIFRGGFKE